MELQEKKHIITIGGMLGSGKSSTAQLVAERLNYTHYSAGDVMRQLGKEQGIDDIRAFNIASEGKKKFDYEVDERTKLIGKTETNVVFDSHMAWRFIPNSFKVFLNLDETAAAERILAGMTPERRSSEEVPDSVAGYAGLLKERKASNVRRYVDLYQVNPYAPELYDFVVETSQHSLSEVADIVIDAYNAWLGYHSDCKSARFLLQSLA